MKSRNRNVWIIAIAALVIAGCCVVALAAGVVGWFTSRYAYTEGEPLDLGGTYRERVEESLAVSGIPSLQITNFAGSVAIQSGEANAVHVVAIKRASSRSRLDRIEVNMSAQGQHLVIRTEKAFTSGNASVELEITAPPGSQVNVDTGAGDVEIHGISGPIDIRSGAGDVDVSGARGTVVIDQGVGEIRYEGAPSGICRFQTGAGEIILRLPSEPNVQVDLGTGWGSVDIGWAVDGSVSPRRVEGVIGNGRQGSVFAHTGVGTVSVRRQ